LAQPEVGIGRISIVGIVVLIGWLQGPPRKSPRPVHAGRFLEVTLKAVRQIPGERLYGVLARLSLRGYPRCEQERETQRGGQSVNGG
jgi:hypothetical protein